MRHVPRYGEHGLETQSISGGMGRQSIRNLTNGAALLIASLIQSGAKAEPPATDTPPPLNTVNEWVRDSRDPLLEEELEKWKQLHHDDLNDPEFSVRDEGMYKGDAIARTMVDRMERKISPVSAKKLFALSHNGEEVSLESRWRGIRLMKPYIDAPPTLTRIPLFDESTAADALHTLDEETPMEITIPEEMRAGLARLIMPAEANTYVEIVYYTSKETGMLPIQHKHSLTFVPADGNERWIVDPEKRSIKIETAASEHQPSFTRYIHDPQYIPPDIQFSGIRRNIRTKFSALREEMEKRMMEGHLIFFGP